MLTRLASARQKYSSVHRSVWKSTVLADISDSDGNTLTVRLLLCSALKSSVIFSKALRKRKWLIKERSPVGGLNFYRKRKYNKKSKVVVTFLEDGKSFIKRFGFPMTFQVIVNNELDLPLHYLSSIPRGKRLRFPFLSKSDYSRFIDYLYINRCCTADPGVYNRHRKWLSFDGILGSEYFDAVGLTTYSEQITDKFSIGQSALGTLLIEQEGK